MLKAMDIPFYIEVAVRRQVRIYPLVYLRIAGEGIMLACSYCEATGLTFSPSVVSSFLGARVGGILRSRAAGSDLSCFNSSSLPHVLEMMVSRWGHRL